MVTSLLQVLFVFAASWALWKILRIFFRKDTLRHLPGPPSESLIFGNIKQLYSPEGITWHHDLVRIYGRAFKINGMFGDQQVYITDPTALHHVLVKDQHIYEETSMFIETNKLIFGDGLFSTLGDKHRKQRKLLNPVFSVAHLRHLPPVFYRITHLLRDKIKQRLENGPQEIDMLFWMSRAALEYIGQGGLGYSFGDFGEKDLSNEYLRAVRDLIKTLAPLQAYQQSIPYVVKVGSRRFRRFLVDHLPSRSFRKLRDIVDVMEDASKMVLENKRNASTQNGDTPVELVGDGKDIMSILLRENALADEAERLSESELLGQMSTLIFAAHETTSTALSRMLHVLALHPDAQARLRKEVTAARRERGDLAYDDLMALPYLDAFVRESLRLYAPINFFLRTTRQDVVLPLGTPIKSADGKTDISEILLKNNTDVIMGLGAVNRDPEIWGDDAHLWKPERWLGKTTEQVVSARVPGVYSGMMTFLGGGRACIGFKFSLLEIKIVLSMLLEEFSFAADKEILWRLNGIATPATKGREYDTPHLPLRVSRVDDSR